MFANELVSNFRDFLIACWPSMLEVTTYVDWDNDSYFVYEWLEMNWKFLVERQLVEGEQALPLYGFFGLRNENDNATHRMMCWNKNPELCYQFLHFVAKLDGQSRMEPPFDFIEVLDVETDNRLILPYDGVIFFMAPIP